MGRESPAPGAPHGRPGGSQRPPVGYAGAPSGHPRWEMAMTNPPADEERTGPLRVTVVSDFI
ncbi:MAG: hypothetical protein WC273_02525 [Dehalococcoidia bacterium]